MGKSKKSARADRQKVIDDIRRQQKRSANRQGTLIIGVCVVIAATLVVAAAWKPVSGWVRKEAISADSLAEIGAAPSVCDDVITKDQESASHVEPAQVQYTKAPPATGDHWNIANKAPVPIEQRFYSRDDRPELEQFVHNSEHGYTILWYDDTVSAGEIAEINKMADFLDDNDTNGRFKFKAVPWTEEDTAEVEEALQAAVTDAQQAAATAEAAAKSATGKDKKAAEQQAAAAATALEAAKKRAEEGSQFPEGMHIAFTHWTAEGKGVWKYCSEPSGEALEEFMFDYPFSDSPEPNAM